MAPNTRPHAVRTTLRPAPTDPDGTANLVDEAQHDESGETDSTAMSRKTPKAAQAGSPVRGDLAHENETRANPLQPWADRGTSNSPDGSVGEAVED